MLMSAFDDKEYMAWYKQEAAMSNPEIEYGAWLAGRRAAEAQRDELQRGIDGICELYGTLTIVAAVASMHAERKQRDELAAQLATAQRQLQDEITRRESAERGLAEMIKAHSEAMTRLSKYEKVTA